MNWPQAIKDFFDANFQQYFDNSYIKRWPTSAAIIGIGEIIQIHNGKNTTAYIQQTLGIYKSTMNGYDYFFLLCDGRRVPYTEQDQRLVNLWTYC